MLLTVKYPIKLIGITMLALSVGFSINDHIFTTNFEKVIILKDSLNSVQLTKDIRIKNYFSFIDSLVDSFNQNINYKLTEHILVRNNPWIIHNIVATDYYKMIEKDSFVYNQKEMVVLKKGDKIVFPNAVRTDSILKLFQKTMLDVNIPAFKLRILNDTLCLYEFKVRVGKNQSRYLKMGDRITNLRTKTGTGSIVSHVRNPDYYNPVSGKQYYLTKRDDKKTTKMPQIPFLETEISGVRNGQMIHPTTNPETLGKPYSNGCIGVSEADAWIIYYYAPIGTKITIRYDLNTENGKQILNDIYGNKLNE